MAKKQNKNWVKTAVKHPGAFRAYCKRKGYSKVNTACINEGLKSPSKTVRKRAALAKAFKNMRKNKKKK